MKQVYHHVFYWEQTSNQNRTQDERLRSFSLKMKQNALQPAPLQIEVVYFFLDNAFSSILHTHL